MKPLSSSPTSPAVNKPYSIGQVVYVLNNLDQTVVPLLINEETNHRTRSGETTSYKVLCDDNPNGAIELAYIKGEVYESLDLIEEVLVSRFKEFVKKLCDGACTKAEAYGWETTTPTTTPNQATGVDTTSTSSPIVSAKQPELFSIKPQTNVDDSSITQVVMEDGTVVRMNLDGVL